MGFPLGTCPCGAPLWVGSIVNETHRLSLWPFKIKPKQKQQNPEIPNCSSLSPVGVYWMCDPDLPRGMVFPSLKKLINNTLLVEVRKKTFLEPLLEQKYFHNLKIKTYLHNSLNSSKGAVTSPHLSLFTQDKKIIYANKVSLMLNNHFS